MFESAEIGHSLDKPTYRRREPRLRRALLEAQSELLERRAFPVVVLVNGVDGAGKGETVNLLNEWMDPRHIHTSAFGARTQEERDRPEMWRFWRALPPRGRIGILFGSWYTDPILERVMGHDKRSVFERRLERIRRFERMLAAEGAVVLKLWFHLSHKAQERRLRKLSRSRRTAWKVTEDDWKRFRHYHEFVEVCAEALRRTSSAEAPWHVIEGSDARYRSITAGSLLLSAMRSRLEGAAPTVAGAAPPPAPAVDGRTLLATLAPRARTTVAEYERRLERLQARLNEAMRGGTMRRRSLVLVFEGMDAAGKGSTIRRVTRAMDARFFRVIPVAAPTDEERDQPYLWRFWRHLPEPGHCAIFDRSWYGRVLVERVEGFCRQTDWMRAYDEINDFESQLADAGAVVAKFWLAVSPQEQLRRFKARQGTAHKRFKITDEDWRNRRRRPAYDQAVCDMVDRTSTETAPWQLIAADDKHGARLEVLERLCRVVERAE
ncbi:MAG: polyphosphate:AMP phosphotransferase [Phycisphaerales bacterium]